MTQPTPKLPGATLDISAAAVHETFMAHVRAGFTRDEAMLIVLKHMELAHTNWKAQQGE